jgi:DNA modification methylase
MSLGALRPNKVYKGDSLYLLSRLPDRSIGAVVTDPPFFVGIGRNEGRFGADPWAEDVTSATKALEWARPYAVQFGRVVRPGGAVVLMAGAHAVAAWMNACEEAGLIWMAELVVLWNTGKPRARNFGSLHTHILWFAVPGARHVWNSSRRAIYSNVLVCSKLNNADKLHPAQKPVELTTFLISLLTRDGDTVLDPFCGSGSTLVSAQMVGRDYIGFDADAEYVRIAAKRALHYEVEGERELYLWINGRIEEV